jgi:hypothetical protein
MTPHHPFVETSGRSENTNGAAFVLPPYCWRH